MLWPADAPPSGIRIGLNWPPFQNLTDGAPIVIITIF